MLFIIRSVIPSRTLVRFFEGHRPRATLIRGVARGRIPSIGLLAGVQTSESGQRIVI